jgi:O-methyltransferase
MDEFIALYNRYCAKTKMKPGLARRDRFFNLCSAYELVRGKQGEDAECGVYKGLSSALLLTIRNEVAPYHIFDSFEGLSEPEPGDVHKRGNFTCDLDTVRHNLAEFPYIDYHAGWIPEVFADQPERTYRFVHIDLDLPKPTKGALEYFHTRLIPGGVMICDDYSDKGWVGTREAVNEFLKKSGRRGLQFSSGNLLIA